MVLRATKGDEDMGCFRYFFAGSSTERRASLAPAYPCPHFTSISRSRASPCSQRK